MRRHGILGFMLLGVLGCQAGNAPAPTAGEPPNVARSPVLVQKASGAGLVAQEGARPVGAEGASLTGLDGASLIGLDGASLVGLDGASLVGLDGATLSGELKLPPGLIGLDGASLIGLDGSSYKRAGGYALKATEERPVAGAWVYLRDAEGRFVVGADKQLLRAQTDAEGRFAFPNLKAERGIFFYAALGRKGDELLGVTAIRPKDQVAPVRVDVASTLLASWVKEDVLPKQSDRQLSLSRLTDELNAKAREAAVKLLNPELTAAIKQLGSGEVAARARQLALRNRGFGEVLEEMRRVMTLAGLNACENGTSALAVPVPLPIGLAAAPDGSFYVTSHYTGQVVRVDPNGLYENILGACKEDSRGIASYDELVVGGDGKLYLSSRSIGAMWRCNLDGSGLKRWNLVGEQLVESDRLLDLDFVPDAFVAAGQNGTVWVKYANLTNVAPGGTNASWTGGLACLDANGKVIRRVNRPGSDELLSATETPDGALWVLGRLRGVFGIHRLARDTEDFQSISLKGLENSVSAHAASLLAEPDNTILLTVGGSASRHAIYRISPLPEAAPELWAGGATSGVNMESVNRLEAQFSRPSRLARRKDGAVLVADYDNGLIHAIQGDVVTRVAGSRAQYEELAAESPLAIPQGLTLGAQGRPVLAETGAHAIRRLQDGKLVKIAGGQSGFTGHARASATLLGAPSEVAAVGDDFFLVEADGWRVRRLYANGEIESVTAGEEGRTEWEPERPLAREYHFEAMLGLTTMPDGRPVFSGQLQNSSGEYFEGVWRVELDGRLTHLAGSPSATLTSVFSGKNGPGVEFPLGKILSLAVGPDESIYMGDVRSCQILRLKPDGQMERFIGGGTLATAAALLGDWLQQPSAVPALEAAIAVPRGLAFDQQGRLLVSEAGTRVVKALSELFDLPKALLLVATTAVPDVDGRIRRLESDGRLVTLAGVGAPAGRDTLVRNPMSIVVDPQGQLLFIESHSRQLKSLKLDD